MFPAPARAAAATEFSEPPTWPLRTFLELGALVSAIPCARSHVRAVAREWGLEKLADTAELLTSEIVTNAIRAAQRLRTQELPVVRLQVLSDRTSIVIRVWDGNHGMPVLRYASPDDESGRGLEIIDALAADWSAYRDPGGGKVVWALIRP
jgi:anti-sigma regulatory factor (Ser/Thr protein kinase)